MTTTTEKDIIITRSFEAPVERLWRAWTDPDYFARWWGPKAFTAPHVKIDFRAGGRYLYCMRGPGPDGVTKDFWSTGVYKEIEPLKRIVSTDSFADKDGKVVPASYYGMPGDWPLEMTVEVTFEEYGGETMMTLRHSGIPREMMGECQSGWSESLDKLEEVLK